MVRITARGDVAVWDRFEQPHRPARDYDAFGPFRVERHHYDAALRELSAAADALAGRAPRPSG